MKGERREVGEVRERDRAGGARIKIKIKINKIWITDCGFGKAESGIRKAGKVFR